MCMGAILPLQETAQKKKKLCCGQEIFEALESTTDHLIQRSNAVCQRLVLLKYIVR
jgi:hypothetical protein